ncbi:MAG: hypothetical protein IIC76_02395 [Bacteroidetes bacterium]|nr:hypothetical protein [Bacteroidota bacterium]
MKITIILVVSIFLLTFVSICRLSAQNFASEGTWEVGGNVSYTSTTSVSNGETSENSLGVFSLDVPFYYFVIDGLELGIIPSYQNFSSGGSSASIFNILFGTAYNIKTNSSAYPFIEGRIGYNTTSNGTTRTGIVWAIIGGVKAQVGSNALINFGISYTQSTLNSENQEGGRSGTNVIGGQVGFTVFFGK